MAGLDPRQTSARSQAGADCPGPQGSVPGSLVTYFFRKLLHISEVKLLSHSSPHIRKWVRVPNMLKLLGAVSGSLSKHHHQIH